MLNVSKSCLLCGVGGQGTILASKLIADSALANGVRVHSAETIGMAQRGGSVVSHVRIGEVNSPMIPKKMADVIIAFEPSEAVRNLDYLKNDGVMVVSKKAVKPVTSTLSSSQYTGQEMLDYLATKVEHLIVVDGETICNNLGSSKVLNVVLLGAATATGMLGITETDISNAIRNRLPEKLHELNENALKAGAELA